ncbi:MAG: ABC transporter ATP-binding protein [Halobacteriales archaeon]
MTEQPPKTTDSRDGRSRGSAGIDIEGLTKEYGNVVAVDDLDLTVEDGELLVLLGPSGCGKSTTLRCIAGLELPSGGAIHVAGEELTRTPPQNRDLAIVFQSYALYPHLTARENLEFALGKTDLSEAEKTERVEDTAELLEVSELLDKKPAQLSGGQRQRIAVGRSVVREPKAFLMDEPLSNLDAKLRVQTRTELRELQQELGTTMVYVTHDQEEAMSIADRIAIMEDGEVQQVGTPEAVYHEPVNEFVAGFVGDPSMNFFDIVEWRDESCQVGTGSDPLTVSPFDATVDDRAHTFGIRPEDVTIDGSLAERTNGTTEAAWSDPIGCEVDVIEPLGNAHVVKFRSDGGPFTGYIRYWPGDLSRNDSAAVRFDLGAAHLFDRAGRRIEPGPSDPGSSTAGGEWTDG